MTRTKAAAAALVTGALLAVPLVATAATVDSISFADRRGDIQGNKKMRQARSIDLTRATYTHDRTDAGVDTLIVKYKVRKAFGAKDGRVQVFASGTEALSFGSHFRPNGTLEVYDADGQVPCEGATERIDRRRDVVTHRVPVDCLGGTTEGSLESLAGVMAMKSGKMAVDFTRPRAFSWAPLVVE